MYIIRSFVLEYMDLKKRLIVLNLNIHTISKNSLHSIRYYILGKYQLC